MSIDPLVVRPSSGDEGAIGTTKIRIGREEKKVLGCWKEQGKGIIQVVANIFVQNFRFSKFSEQ